ASPGSAVLFRDMGMAVAGYATARAALPALFRVAAARHPPRGPPGGSDRARLLFKRLHGGDHTRRYAGHPAGPDAGCAGHGYELARRHDPRDTSAVAEAHPAAVRQRVLVHDAH